MGETLESIIRYFDELEQMMRAISLTDLKKVLDILEEGYHHGHRIFVMGNGGSACDALHVAVEFKHPIVEKRRALPAEALTADIATLSAISNDLDFSRIFVNQLRLLGQPDDMALAISTSGQSPNLIYALEAARDRGLMTIAFTGKDGGRLRSVSEYCFIVPSFSIHRIQEVHATLIHAMWDMIHVALGEEDVI